MVITPNHSTNEALCRNSHGPPRPTTASMTPVPSTATEVRMTSGPSTRRIGAGGPLRTYGREPAVVPDEPVHGRGDLQQHRPDQQEAHQEVQDEQPVYRQDRDALDGEAEQQQRARHRGQLLVALDSGGGHRPPVLRRAARGVRRPTISSPGDVATRQPERQRRAGVDGAPGMNSQVGRDWLVDDRVAPFVQLDQLGQQVRAQAVPGAGDRVDLQLQRSSPLPLGQPAGAPAAVLAETGPAAGRRAFARPGTVRRRA